MKKSRFLFGMAISLSLLFSCGEQPAASSEPAVTSSAAQGLPAPVDLGDSVGELRIHYFRKDGKYASWAMWIWADGKDGSEYTFKAGDDYGGIIQIPLSKYGSDASALKMGYIVKTAGNWAEQTKDRFIELSTLVPNSGVYQLWLKDGDDEAYAEEPTKLSAKARFINDTTVLVESYDEFKAAAVLDNGTKVKEVTLDKAEDYARIELPAAGDATHPYTAEVTFTDGKKLVVKVAIGALYDGDNFKNNYVYSGDDLGVTYAAASSTFKVWSPLANEMKLRIYESGTPKSVDANKGNDTYQEVAMAKGEKGVWTATANGDLEGKYYTYFVKNSVHPTGVEVVDPYAKSAGVNGVRGMIVDFSKTNPEGWAEIAPIAVDKKELVVYETHVCDVTSSETWNGPAAKAKTFEGLIETGTTYEGVKTGFDHIKELGVNAVQFVPIFDQDNDEINTSFNWGYNPLNYNVLEGSYSSDPHDGYARIKEFKKVVAAYHEAGMNIIMDVVYNHVSNAANCNFEALVPGYFFRADVSGNLYNGSGCGNETASDRAMYNKFMRDSTKFWAKEYKLGGFRFDLMGLHDIKTMNELTADLKQINPNIAVYGEPWTGGTSGLSGSLQAKQDNREEFVGYGAFNDSIRDALIAGGMAEKGNLAWTDGFPDETDVKKLVAGLKGGLSETRIDPDKNVSYVTCHDNYTLYDRYKATGRFTDKDEIKQMALLAQSIALLSQGTGFMLAGEEFLRTKGGDHNSYQSSYKVNELDYALKKANPDVFAYYQTLIGLKKGVSGLHLGANDAKNLQVESSVDLNLITYEFTGGDGQYKAIFAGPKTEATQKVDLAGYSLVLSSIGEPAMSAATPIAPRQVIIAKK